MDDNVIHIDFQDSDIVQTKNPEQIDMEQLYQFYESNQDAIDVMGGPAMFESLLALSDEDFEQLKPAMLEVFTEVLSEPRSIREMSTLFLTLQYDLDSLNEDLNTALEAIDTINFLSQSKKDFLKEITSATFNAMQSVANDINQTINIPCELSDGISVPTYAHNSDAALDIYSPSEFTIAPGETVIIPTGIKCAIPEGYAILIQPRSGQSVKTKLRIANTPGLIDAGYRDEIGVIVENIEPPFKDIDYEFDDEGNIKIKSILHGESYTISKGQRFAQMRLVQVPKAIFMPVDSVREIGEDRGGGFGSSGL